MADGYISIFPLLIKDGHYKYVSNLFLSSYKNHLGQTAIGEVRIIANYLGYYPWEFESPFVLYKNP